MVVNSAVRMPSVTAPASKPPPALSTRNISTMPRTVPSSPSMGAALMMTSRSVRFLCQSKSSARTARSARTFIVSASCASMEGWNGRRPAHTKKDSRSSTMAQPATDRPRMTHMMGPPASMKNLN